MHFPPSFLHLNALSLNLATASSLLSPRSEPWIKWCNDVDATKNCQSEKIDLGQCKLIPDSNAKGDKGSSVYIFSAPLAVGALSCQTYEGPGCTSGKWIGTSFTASRTFDGDVMWRSYKCWDNEK